ncbi:hypothetical protein [Phytohabitans suffuscus]|uniref:hypothetical protein n=1 Tax=Phytohabitans suffuscus TaxID=624315 RepID=UPI002F96B0C0
MTARCSARCVSRPPSRLVPHEPEKPSRLTRLWAVPAYRLIYDPDCRPRRHRRAGTW